jgi:hypothetical protein
LVANAAVDKTARRLPCSRTTRNIHGRLHLFRTAFDSRTNAWRLITVLNGYTGFEQPRTARLGSVVFRNPAQVLDASLRSIQSRTPINRRLRRIRHTRILHNRQKRRRTTRNRESQQKRKMDSNPSTKYLHGEITV